MVSSPSEVFSCIHDAPGDEYNEYWFAECWMSWSGIPGKSFGDEGKIETVSEIKKKSGFQNIEK